MDIAVRLRKKYMGWVRDVTDPGYYILTAKTSPLSPE
jgi:hypothetical protein